jgi:hypothetical protein
MQSTPQSKRPNADHSGAALLPVLTCVGHKLQLSFDDGRFKKAVAVGFIQQKQAKIRCCITFVIRMCQYVDKFTNYLKSKAIPV